MKGLWSTLALIAAARLFSREDVMVGERVSLTFSFKRSTFEERDRPSLGEGFAWDLRLLAMCSCVAVCCRT